MVPPYRWSLKPRRSSLPSLPYPPNYSRALLHAVPDLEDVTRCGPKRSGGASPGASGWLTSAPAIFGIGGGPCRLRFPGGLFPAPEEWHRPPGSSRDCLQWSSLYRESKSRLRVAASLGPPSAKTSWQRGRQGCQNLPGVLAGLIVACS